MSATSATNDPKRNAPADLKKLGGSRCGEPAFYNSLYGYRCERCAELLRESMRNPATLITFSEVVLALRSRSRSCSSRSLESQSGAR